MNDIYNIGDVLYEPILYEKKFGSSEKSELLKRKNKPDFDKKSKNKPDFKKSSEVRKYENMWEIKNVWEKI
jgi:hypothetical protein